jgi:hypothetical protein
VVNLYKKETEAVVNRFLQHQLSFPDCIAALDSALFRVVSRMQPEDLGAIRTMMLTNNDTVMTEMEQRPIAELGVRQEYPAQTGLT